MYHTKKKGSIINKGEEEAFQTTGDGGIQEESPKKKGRIRSKGGDACLKELNKETCANGGKGTEYGKRESSLRMTERLGVKSHKRRKGHAAESMRSEEGEGSSRNGCEE